MHTALTAPRPRALQSLQARPEEALPPCPGDCFKVKVAAPSRKRELFSKRGSANVFCSSSTGQHHA